MRTGVSVTYLEEIFLMKTKYFTGNESSTSSLSITVLVRTNNYLIFDTFTIVEKIPQKRIHLQVKHPAPLNKEEVLKALKFDKSWYDVVSTEFQE